MALRPTKLDVTSFGINVSRAKLSTLSLNPNEYLVVGEKFTSLTAGDSNNLYSMIVDSEGVSVNYSLLEREATLNDYATQIRGNTLIDGNLIITGVITTDPNSSNITGGSSNFWKYANTNSIYYEGNVTIGNYTDAVPNKYALNLNDFPNRDIDYAQLAVQNRANATLRTAVLGNACNSPIVFNTPEATPIEFHINRKRDFFLNLYQQSNLNINTFQFELQPSDLPAYTSLADAPSLVIDGNGNVGIRTDFNRSITYRTREKSPTTPEIIYPIYNRPMALHVTGPMYASNILIFDADFNQPRDLNEIFVRQVGQSIEACNIIPGAFPYGTFTFQNDLNVLSNLSVGGSLTASNQSILNDLTVLKDIYADNIYAHNNGSFSNNIIQNNIYFKGNLFKQRFNSNIGSNEWAMIQFDESFFPEPVLSNVFYIGGGFATPGRVGVGINQNFDEVNHQLVSIKRDPTYFELQLSDKSTYGYNKTLFVGHPPTANDMYADGSTVFLTPGTQDDNYNQYLSYAPQNIYFYPGYNQRISQFQINSNNRPTLGIFVNKRVGINTFVPSKALDVHGDISTNGNYYIELPNEPDPIKLGVWRQNSYSYILGSNTPATYKGIYYYDPEAGHVGVNTIPQADYGMVVGNKLLSTQGYYTSEGYKHVAFYDPLEIYDKPTPPYERAYFNGKVGIGVLSPQATLHLRDTNSPTSLQLSQSLQSTSTYVQFSGNNINWMLHSSDNLNLMELYQGSSTTYQQQTLNRPWQVYRKTGGENYQMVINSNQAVNNTHPTEALLVNGNVKVFGDVNVTGTYRVAGASVLISGSQAAYTYDNTNPNNIYIAGEDIYMNANVTTTTSAGAIYIGYTASIPDESVNDTNSSEKSLLYMQQPNQVSRFITKYKSSGNYCLSEYRNSVGGQCVFGITDTNPVFIGKNTDTPYITVREFINGQNIIGIGTTTTNNSKLQVYTSVDGQSLLKLTHGTANADQDDYTSDLMLEKVTSSTQAKRWTIQGPNSAYQQKLQFTYGENSDPSTELFTFTNQGYMGIGNTQPQFAIDILKTGSQGAIRMLQTDPNLAKPQLLFQSGSNQYGADRATDYRMYSFSNSFYLDMQDNVIGQQTLFHFTSNRALGIHAPADPTYEVTIGGSLNVTDTIYVNGTPVFTIGDEDAGTGTTVQGRNIYINPDPLVYGGVHINSGATQSSNVFQVTAGLNGNTAVFKSTLPDTQIHLLNRDTSFQRRIWRMAASNQSYVLAYRSNFGTDESLIDDLYTNYSKAQVLTQTDTPGTYQQTLYGNLSLQSTQPTLSLNQTLFTDTYLAPSSTFSIGSNLSLSAKLALFNDSPALDTLTIITPNITHTINPIGNIGIGTTLPTSLLQLAQGQFTLHDGTNSSPSLSFTSAPSTGLYLATNDLNLATNGQARMTITNTGQIGINTSPTALLHTSSSSQTNTILQHTGTGDILQVIAQSTPSLTIDQNGNLGIGTTTPTASFSLQGTFSAAADLLPAQTNTYSLGSSTLQWKDIHLAASSLYLDTMQVSNSNNTLTIQDAATSNLLPLNTKHLTLDHQTTLAPNPTNPVFLPKFITSNDPGNIQEYTPIVTNLQTNTTGIGTYIPQGSLHVYSTTTIPTLSLTQNSTGDLLNLSGPEVKDRNNDLFQIKFLNNGLFSFGTPNTDARVTIADNRYKSVLYLNQQNDPVNNLDILQLANQGTTKTVFNQYGYLGIGTLLPQYPLHNQGNTYLASNLTVEGNAIFNCNVDIYGYTWSHGDIYQVSDRRLKFDLTPIESALDKIEKLSGYTFQMYNQEKRQLGLIAQDVQAVIPEAVREDNTGYLGISYGNMIGLLVEGIKELREEVRELRANL